MITKIGTVAALVTDRAEAIGSIPKAARAWGIPTRTVYEWVDGTQPSRLYRPVLARCLGITEVELDALIVGGRDGAHAG